MMKNRLVSILNTHSPISMLRSDYADALSGKTVTIDSSNKWVSHRVMAEFMLSELRKVLDKKYMYEQLKSTDKYVDNIDHKGRV